VVAEPVATGETSGLAGGGVGAYAGDPAAEWAVSVPVLTPQTRVTTALRLLREHGVPALPVCSGGRYAGMVDERALLRLHPSEATTLAAYELPALLDQVGLDRVLDGSAPAVGADEPLAAVGWLLARTGYPAATVLDGTVVLGIVTWRTALGALTAPVAVPVRGAAHGTAPPLRRPAGLAAAR